MLKYFRLVNVILLVLIILTGCNSKDSLPVKDGLSGEEIDKYLTENKIKALGIESRKNSAAIVYEGSDEHGMVLLSKDGTTGRIEYTKGTIDPNGELDKIEYIQVGDEYEAYVGVFIFDESLKEKEADIYIEFKDKEPYEPYAIQTSIDKNDALIFSYKKQKDFRKIKGIDVIDRKGNVIYSKPIQ